MKKVVFIILLLLAGVKVHANCATGIVAAPVIDSISVLPNGDVVICWHMPAPVDPDLAGFNIWTLDGTSANFNLTPGGLGPGVNCFTLPAGNANNSSGTQKMQILVEAFDNCPPPGPNSSGIFAGGFVCPMYLEGELDPCTSSIPLNWNAYEFFVSPIVRYEVYMSINAGPYILMASPFNTSYTQLGILSGNTYDFYVTAVNNGGTGSVKSTSNIITPDVSNILKLPKYNYLNNVTVVDSQQVNIQFSIDTAADITSYKVQRATIDSGTFVTVGSVTKFTGMDTLVDYSDNNVNTDTTSYTYRIEAVNEICGFDSNYSNIASTIFIDVVSSPLEAFNTITISEYKEWDIGVLRYDIYRIVGGVWEPNPVASLPAFTGVTTYVDDISEVLEGNGEFCYNVVAVSKGVPVIAQSSSNEACALHDVLVYIPNAFAPAGLYNKEFKPILTFTNPSTYLFRVFNRWGEVVFQTRSVSEAWNGSVDNSGELSPTGIYFYVLTFNSADGLQFTKRGTVTIVD